MFTGSLLFRDMRAIVWHGPGRVALERREVPSPGPGQVLVKVLFNGLCSTDYPIVEGQVAGSWPGMVLGHEPVGVVVALGEGVVRPGVGDRVVLDTMIACGSCRFCRQGHTELCAHSDEIGFTLDGNWSDYATLPAANLHVLRDDIGDLGGRRIADSAGAVHTMRSAPQVRADEGFDVVIDAVGTQETTLAALSLARRGGRVLLYGLRSAVIDRFPLGQAIFRNLTLLGRTSAPWMWGPAMDLVARGAVRLRPMIGEVIALEDVPALLIGQRGHGGPLKRIVRVAGKEEGGDGGDGWKGGEGDVCRS